MPTKKRHSISHGETAIHDETTGLHLFTIHHGPEETTITDRTNNLVYREKRHGVRQEPKEPA